MASNKTRVVNICVMQHSLSIKQCKDQMVKPRPKRPMSGSLVALPLGKQSHCYQVANLTKSGVEDPNQPEGWYKGWDIPCQVHCGGNKQAVQRRILAAEHQKLPWTSTRECKVLSKCCTVAQDCVRLQQS